MISSKHDYFPPNKALLSSHMPYNLRPRHRDNHPRQSHSQGVSVQPNSETPSFIVATQISARESSNAKPIVFLERIHSLPVDSISAPGSEDSLQSRWEPILLPASRSERLAELPKEIWEFVDPIEVGRGRSGTVYRIEVGLNNWTQEIAVKLSIHSRISIKR